MQIRQFCEADQPQVVRLWREVFGYDAPHNDPELMIRRKMAAQPDLFFVGEVETHVVGTLMAGYDGHRGWIYLLAVHPEHRRRGLGSALLTRAQDELAARGCLKINLQVMAENQDVVAFYQAHGFDVERRNSMGK